MLPPSLPRITLTVRLVSAALFFLVSLISPKALEIDGVPVELSVRSVSDRCVRLTLRPVSHPENFPVNPALVEEAEGEQALRLTGLQGDVETTSGLLRVRIQADPLEVRIVAPDDTLIQSLRFDPNGEIRFDLDDHPVLGLGEGGPRPRRGTDWRQAKVEFDRRGRLHRMEPRWQSDAYGSRNPVPLLIGTSGWGLYFATPWGRIDLSSPDHGRFAPVEWRDPEEMRQTHGNQREQLGKGIPPMEHFVAGFRDVFIFDTRDPLAFMKDLSTISGAAALPPKWSLGYMQSHRTLEDDTQMIEIVDTFREKRIPVDAVIYLGTGFTPRGWNTRQPSFDFNPEVFKRSPEDVIDDLHDRNVKAIVHMVPWDRDRLPMMDGTHLMPYWAEHEPLVRAGVDAWWPDEGDWFDLFERMKRHQLYHDGPLSTQPDRRPWSLHRNGHLGIARWGGWVWSGDTDSTWKSLEAQISVGINHSLSLSPFWGSDIGGFFPTSELTGELYARWFQFGAFCPSFRSHGRTWWTRLPWGWGLDTLGPIEGGESPDASALNDPHIEVIARRYAELRYKLLPYNYTLSWEAREYGLPMMRALWLHHPKDQNAHGIGDQYLWGRDILVAPVYKMGASSRSIYLPAGTWYDWWTGEQVNGGKSIERKVDLDTLPLYVRAGAIIPMDPVRQFVSEPVTEPTVIRIHPGANGDFTLYEDEGDNLNHVSGAHAQIRFRWTDSEQTLTIDDRIGSYPGLVNERSFQIEIPTSAASSSPDPVIVDYSGQRVRISIAIR